MAASNTSLLRKFYFASLFISILVGVLVFVFYYTEKPTYHALGKFTYFYEAGTQENKTYLPYVSDTISKSLAESVSSRLFLESLYSAANVKISPALIRDPSKLIRARVLTGSSVIQVEIFSSDRDALNRISKHFYDVLKRSSIISDQGLKPELSIIDPLYVEPKPSYPKPFEYAALAFIGTLLVSLMFLYIFSSNE